MGYNRQGLRGGAGQIILGRGFGRGPGMSDSDDAYAAALRLIEAARVEGAERLDLDQPETRALTRLPPEIAGLNEYDLLASSNHILASSARRIGEPLRLKTLILSNTQVSDLSPLAGLTGITALGLDNTYVSDLSPLAGLTGITSLSLDNTQVSDLSPLVELTEITGLWLSYTPVSDLSPLAGMTALIGLWLNDTQVSDLSPLARAIKLTTLSLKNTQVSDLSPLATYKKLKFLDISSCPIIDLRIVRAIPRLLGPFESKNALEAFGLHFKFTQATHAAPRIAEIAEIKDNAERARVLFEYLEGWEVPGASTPRPEPVEPPAPFVFLSYASPDRPQIAGLRDFLRGQSVPLWWDQDIPGGDSWRSRVLAQLESARAVVTFWTTDSAASKAVIEEASRAQAAGKLVPVRLDDAPLPFGFSETQYVDLRGWDGTPSHPQMRKLLQALHDKLNPRDLAALTARLSAASPVAMLPERGKLAPFDTPPRAPPEVTNDPDLADRLVGLRQILIQVQPMAADRDKYQCPSDLGVALGFVEVALNAEKVSWYGIQNAQIILSDCINDHDAKSAWNAVLFSALNRLVKGMKGLRPLLQPRQVPPDIPGAKPPETDPVVHMADVADVFALAEELSAQLATEEAIDTLNQDAIDVVRFEIELIKSAEVAPTEDRKFALLRKGVVGLAYMSGAIIGGISIGVGVNLLTTPGAAIILSQRLQPILDRLMQFFL